jgi:hypothetical protein
MICGVAVTRTDDALDFELQDYYFKQIIHMCCPW